MSINLIAAISLTNQLGYKNQLLVHMPNDLKHFKELTTGNVCIMGRKTHQSIGKVLPNRHNVILTHKKNFDVPHGVIVYNSIESILKQYETNKDIELFVIGGQTLYEQFLPYADKIYLTIIETIFEKADVFFPKFSTVEWKISERISFQKDEQHEYNYHFVTYTRRNK